MPLIHSCSKKARSANIRELVHSGYQINQAIGIAMHEACKAKRKKKKKLY